MISSCERDDVWLDEAKYAIDTNLIPRGGQRRRKSQEPRRLSLQGGSLVPRSAYCGRGLFVVKPVLTGEKARYQTFVTAKGLQWLAGRMKKPVAAVPPAPATGDLFASGGAS